MAGAAVAPAAPTQRGAVPSGYPVNTFGYSNGLDFGGGAPPLPVLPQNLPEYRANIQAQADAEILAQAQAQALAQAQAQAQTFAERRAAEAEARSQQQRVDLGQESDAQMTRRLGYMTRADVQAKQLADEAVARAMAEEQEEYERQQAEEDAARQEIEDAIAEADYRELSQDEQTYLDYGDF